MEVTIDKFGRILIPKKLRQLLGLIPGQRVELVAQKEERILSLKIPINPESVEILITDFGLPVIQNGEPGVEKFDTVGFLKDNRKEYLDLKMGLK